MSTNSAIFEIFEQLKKNNADIVKGIKTIEELAVANSKNQGSDSEIKKILIQIQEDVHLRQTEGNKHFDQIKEALLLIYKNNIIHIHKHTIDFIPSRNFIFMISLVVGFLSFTGLYFHQFVKNKRLTDSDLKYRYIKMEQGVDANSLFMLEDAFEYHRNKDLIKYIRKEVENYEQAVIRQAENLEKARLKEQKAKKLEDEADQLKREK